MVVMKMISVQDFTFSIAEITEMMYYAKNAE
jgi:hypothetical protein